MDDNDESEVIDPLIIPMSGIAYTSNGRPTTFSLPNSPDVTNPFTEPTAILSSASCGLILYRIPNSSRYHLRLLNSDDEIHQLPSTPADEEPDAPLALVLNIINNEVNCAKIVRALSGSVIGSYFFDHFCIHCPRKGYAADELSVGYNIIPNTAISCGTKAYWLTETPSVVKYDTATNNAGLVSLPPTVGDVLIGSTRQLGIAGDQLCYVLVTESNVNVYILESEAEPEWRSVYSVPVKIRENAAADLKARVPIVCREMPVPLRFESSHKLEVLLWVDGQLVLLQSSLSADIREARRFKMSLMNVVPPPDNIADCVQFALG